MKPSANQLKASKSPSKISKKTFSKLKLDKQDGKPNSPPKTKNTAGQLQPNTLPTKQKPGNKQAGGRTKNQVGELPSDPRVSLVPLQKKPSLLMETSFSKFSNPHLMNPSLADLEIGSPNDGMEGSVSRQDTAGRSAPRGKFAPTSGWQEKMILWETSSDLLSEATKYYKRLFGDLTTLPDSVRTSEEYISQDPVELIQHMQQMDIRASETNLYWIARLQLALPLPPEYACIMTSAHSEALGEDGQHKMYLHKVHLLYLPVHPGTEFVSELIRKMRRVGVDHSKIKDFGKVQEFKDPFGVRCKVDLYLLRLAYDGELDLYEKYVQNNKQMLEELQIENGFKFKSVGKFEGSKSRIEGEEALGEDGKQGLSRAALANIFKQTKGITDLLVLEVCRQAKIDLVIEPELLGLVTEFVMHPPEKFVLGTKGEDKNKLIPQKWESRCPDGKTFFWVNPALKRAQAAYPYLAELHAAIDKQKKQVEAVSSLGKYKRDASKLSFLFRQSDPEYVKNRILDERTKIISRSVVKRGGKLDELRKELKTLNVDLDEGRQDPVIGSSEHTSQMLSRQDSSDDSGHVSQLPSKMMSRKESFASNDKRPTLIVPQGSNLQLPKRAKGLPRPSTFGLFMSQKKEKEKEQQEKKKTQAAKQALRQLSNLLGGSKILVETPSLTQGQQVSDHPTQPATLHARKLQAALHKRAGFGCCVLLFLRHDRETRRHGEGEAENQAAVRKTLRGRRGTHPQGRPRREEATRARREKDRSRTCPHGEQLDSKS